jgi:hypothetical protein
MNGQARRTIEMGTRADTFSDANPDTNAGYIAAAVKLKGLVKDARAAATAQREGTVAEHNASQQKVELRRAMLSVPIAHLSQVGRVASREEQGLGNSFRFKPTATTLLAFQTAARSMAAEAQTHREVLIKHGLAESVLEHFGQLLDQFDAAVALGNEGRTRHMGATADLKALSAQIRETVRVMDGRNRQRFQGDAHLLASWLSARTIVGTPRGTPDEPVEGQQPAAGDVRPAA